MTGTTGLPAGLEVLVVGSGKPVTMLAHGLGGSMPRTGAAAAYVAALEAALTDRDADAVAAQVADQVPADADPGAEASATARTTFPKGSPGLPAVLRTRAGDVPVRDRDGLRAGDRRPATTRPAGAVTPARRPVPQPATGPGRPLSTRWTVRRTAGG